MQTLCIAGKLECSYPVLLFLCTGKQKYKRHDLQVIHIVFTARKRICGKVMFLHLSVSHSIHRVVCPSACWDTPRPHPGQTPPKWADTPLGRHQPPWVDTAPLSRHPQGDGYCCGRYWNAFLFSGKSLIFLASSLHSMQKKNRLKMTKFKFINIINIVAIFVLLKFADNKPSQYSSVSRAFIYSMIGPNFEPYQCLLTGIWKRSAQLPRGPTRGQSNHSVFATQRRHHQKSKTGVLLAPQKGLVFSKKLFFFQKLQNNVCTNTVVDPGFLWGGGANSPGGSTYDFAKFSQNLHEIERIWTPGGVRPSRPP